MYQQGLFDQQQQQKWDSQLGALQLAMAQNQQARQALQQTTEQQQNALLDSMTGLDQRISQHSRRLQALSTTSREDWLLAEAEYLIRLAQQRLLMERSGDGALALLQAADNILLQVDDADLFAARDHLQRDIAKLKLLPEVDREGLYLKLSALISEVETLPLIPVWQSESSTEATQEAATENTAQVDSAWSTVKASFWRAMGVLSDQIRIRHTEESLAPLLPPDGAAYLKQNLRFYLEQAQLAMLREEQTVYVSSLNAAQQLLVQYFPTNRKASVLADELTELVSRPVSQSLPNINGSLLAVKDYITRLHKLDDQAGSPQLQESGEQQQ